jgi:hypothetical protein
MFVIPCMPTECIAMAGTGGQGSTSAFAWLGAVTRLRLLRPLTEACTTKFNSSVTYLNMIDGGASNPGHRFSQPLSIVLKRRRPASR